MGLDSYIVDELFTGETFPIEDPDLIVLSGYNTGENELLKEAKVYQEKYPKAKIILGGLHIQLNSGDFRKDYIDYLVHSQSLEAFKNIIKKERGQAYEAQGFDYREKDDWTIGEKLKIKEREPLRPDREFFIKNKDKTYYLDKKNVALAKGAVGCPHQCTYCYCRLLNEGHYIGANYFQTLEEISLLPADHIWIVDDILLNTRKDALDFIKAVDEFKINKKFIAYLRADFIIREKDLLKDLKKIGLEEVIIGFEAVSNKELKSYKKTTDSLDYPEVIRILKENKMDYSGLFIVNPDYGFKDFKILKKFIKENKIEVYTLSIFTPIKGTPAYEEYKDRLLTTNPEKFDFLHLVIKPKLPRPIFYILFYGLHLGLLKSKRIRKFIKNSLKKG